jgi:hypothetical protein
MRVALLSAALLSFGIAPHAPSWSASPAIALHTEIFEPEGEFPPFQGPVQRGLCFKPEGRSSISLDVPEIESGPYSVSYFGEFDCTGFAKWEQRPDGASGLSSQDDTCYPFQSECADDFMGDGNSVIGVDWFGVYWNGTPLAPDAFNIRFYSDASGLPGTQLAITTSSTYNETAGNPYEYCSQVDPFTKADGVKYHVSIQAVLCFPPQWGIATGTGNGAQGSFRSALFGFPDWVPSSTAFGLPHELAFYLYNTTTTPVVETTWGSIKATYSQ